jgi:hypothetical protein
MPVAVLRPFGPRGTVETLIARSHSMPSRARRRTASSYHISGYLGQRDEPSALDILRGETSAGDAVSEKDREPSAGRLGYGERASGPQEPRRRRGRRPIPQLILRELSFSGQAMTTGQIARAIEYLPDRTETALDRMESGGRVLRNKEGRWAIVLTKTNGHAATAGNGNPLDAPQRAPQVLQDQVC